jgi:transcription antitermination factor NusG
MKGLIFIVIYSDNHSCSKTLWYVVHCQPRKESYAAHAVESCLGLSVYIPEYKQKSHGVIKHYPLFPGYIFVQADLQKVPLSRINASPGVLGLVASGGDPQPVPNDVIEEIVVRLKHMDTLKREPFCPGDVVRVKHGGPLQDLEMVFMGPMTGSRRVCVLLSFLGRLKQVHLDGETLEKVPSHNAHEERVIDASYIRTRYTRGKGRKVKSMS